MTSIVVALIVGLSAATAPTLAIVTTYLLGKRDSKAAARLVAAEVATVRTTVATTHAENETKLEQIHVLVNSRLTEALQHIDASDVRIAELEQRLLDNTAGPDSPPKGVIEPGPVAHDPTEEETP